MYTLFLTKPEPADIESVIIFKQLGGGGVRIAGGQTERELTKKTMSKMRVTHWKQLCVLLCGWNMRRER